jgi:hypothetical protein
MKVQKNLNLEYEVVEKLNEEDNQTQLVESLLREHYDMEEENES